MADGLLLVDKPGGVTSFGVVREVRRRLGERHTGHAGTLDPLATGLLPVMVGEATKLTPYLQGLDKEYQATVRFGTATDTYDAEGRVTVTADEGALASLTEARVREALAGFAGRIRQRPPIYSAIKRDGKRLYEIARISDGEAVVIEEREVMVYGIEVRAFAPPDLALTVRCGKGTYVRSIAHDLGQALGVPAHLAALRRTRVGSFTVEEAFDPFQLPGDARLPLLPIERAVAHLPAVTVEPEAERRLRCGQQALLQGLAAPLGCRGAVTLLDGDGRLVAIADATPGRLTLARVFNRP